MPAALEDEIVRLRKRLQGQGLDAGAETIRAMLVAGTSMSAPANWTVPAVSTIWRILTRRGFVIPQTHKRPRSSWQRFAATQPNQRWQADVTHWQLADGTDVEILNIIDDHSRLAVGSATRRTTLAPDVVATFATAFHCWGIPAECSPTTGPSSPQNPAARAKSPSRRELRRLRVTFDHSRPYHPQTCGKVERFHQPRRSGWPPAHQRPPPSVRVAVPIAADPRCRWRRDRLMLAAPAKRGDRHRGK